jgi:hypothetical protein
MNTSGASAVAMAAPKSVVERIIGIFTNPRATMEDIVARPTWLIPFIIVSVFAMGRQYLLADLETQVGKDMISSSTKLSDDQKSKILEDMDANSASPMRQAINLAKWPIIILVVDLILAGLLLFSGNTFLGGQSTYKTIFAVVNWSGLISVLFFLVDVPLMRSFESIVPVTSLVGLLSSERFSFTYFFMSMVEFFTIWEHVVIAIGLVAAYKFSLNKSLVVVFSWWILSVLILSALFSLSTSMVAG